jgi:DNA repair protein RecN (Recombination protein N)
MLVELVIENYAVIEQLRVRFHSGLNLLTGETGSGKSIVVDALGLLLGGRASADSVRTGAERARISGIFETPHSRALRELLDQAGLECEDGELLVEREVFANGKSRAFLASRPVTAALLKEIAPHLADIHGQHDQQRLFDEDAQRELLDEYASHPEALAGIAEVHRRWRACGIELEALEKAEQERLRLADLWSFQRREIEAASLTAGEDQAIERERRVLQNVARLEEAATTAYSSLYDSSESAFAAVRIAIKRLEEICRIDPSLAEAMETLKPAEIAIDEASHTLRDYLSRLEADPGRLEEIEARLAMIEKLKRKYGRSVEEILAYLEEVRASLGAAESADQRREDLRAIREGLASEYEKLAGRLSAQRREAARKLARSVESELATLAMDGCVFRIEIGAAPWSEHGADSVNFLVSPNAGEEPRAIEKVASGGEISRIALALKTTIASAVRASREKRRAGATRTLVFDEVDAGIGGRAAETVGRRLKQLAASDQVLCVTHLPQMASFADHHFRVEKRETDGRTTASIEELDATARVREIGRMLSGEKLTPEALRHAEQLIKLGTAE